MTYVLIGMVILILIGMSISSSAKRAAEAAEATRNDLAEFLRSYQIRHGLVEVEDEDTPWIEEPNPIPQPSTVKTFTRPDSIAGNTL